MVPIFAEMARLMASEIRQCDQDQAAGTKDAASLLQLGARIGEMLEGIPERDHIESRRRQRSRGERRMRNPIRAQRARRLAIRERHRLDAISIPAARVQGAQEESQPASHVEDAACGAKSMEEGGAMALVAANQSASASAIAPQYSPP